MTIPKACKRLAEVDFPIAAVSKHAVREKSIRHGHPSTLHLWWARRPLASSRAMLMALLLPDPADPHCPPEFRDEARRLLLAHHGRPVGWSDAVADDLGLRRTLLHFIADFANWDNAANPNYLTTARALVKAAHDEETPLVVDPFAGGGSIPLEALRLGCDAFASDLNPVAVLINKVMLEDIPRYGKAKIPVKKNDGTEVIADGLAEALRIAGGEVKAAAEKELAEFYPPDPDGARPIAYLWARTVRCESPNCGAEIPLVRSFWLAKKANRRRALRYSVVRTPGPTPHLKFEIFEPNSTTDKAVPEGTVSRARATCPCCNTVLPPERVRAQLSAQRGGADVIFDADGVRTGGAFLLAVVTLRPGQTGRTYRLPTAADYAAVWKAQQRIAVVNATPLPNGLSPVPDEPLPLMSGTFNVPLYGMNTWGSVFTSRQQLSLTSLCRLVPLTDEKTNISPLRNLMSLVLDRCADYWSSLCTWHLTRELVNHTYGRQALPMFWDFTEACPWADSSGNFDGAVSWGVHTIAAISSTAPPIGQAVLADAAESSLPDETASIAFTDPPYYYAVPYADLSDYFLVWLKRANPKLDLLRDPFDPNNQLSPKAREICEMARWDPVRYKHKDHVFFEQGMGRAFAECRRILRADGIGSVVFAHKSTEGWEALLDGLVGSEWTITSSWPIATEMQERLRARDSAALATSVHLVCRPRDADAPIGDWNRVHGALPGRVRDWIERLEGEGIRGADLVFACIGPALELYSQYSQVLDVQDRPIPLGGDPAASEPYKRGYLAYVWETVARLALEKVLSTAEANASNGSTAGALEEDARLTALFLWTMQSTEEGELYRMAQNATEGEGEREESESDGEDDDEPSGGSSKKWAAYSLPFDVVRRIAQPLGIHLPVWEERIVKTEKGVVYLLPVKARVNRLFHGESADELADSIESGRITPKDLQMGLFAQEQVEEYAPKVKRRKGVSVTDDKLGAQPGETTLDRVHRAMLLQSAGRTTALRTLLAQEQQTGPAFLRLANALSGLYPTKSEEKRLVDAMLLAYPK